MRKRNWLASLLAAMILVTTALPAVAWAEEGTVTLTEAQATATAETAAEAERAVLGEISPEQPVEPSPSPVAALKEKQTPESASEPVSLMAVVPQGVTMQAWDGVTVDTAWYTGLESASSYTISTAAQLAGVAQLVNEGTSDFKGKTLLLDADIDLAGQEWTPIGGGATSKNFQGVFDGQNHTISNLKITRGLENTGVNNKIGLFGAGTFGTQIQNITLHNVDVSGSLCVGAVLGDSSNALSKLTNVHVTGNINVRGWWYVGGILGKGYASVIDCSVEGDGPATSGVTITGGYAGGIVGFMGEGNCVTSQSHVKDIAVTGAYNGIGGINGILHYGNTISNCTVENTVVWETGGPEEDTGRIYVGAFAGTYLNNDGQSYPTLSDCQFQGELYSGAEKTDVLEAERYVGSLWYGASAPTGLNITNCIIVIPVKPTPVPTDEGGNATPAPTTPPGQQTPAPTAAPVPTVTPGPTAVPTAMPEPVVTAPTATPVPTVTPAPTAVPTVTPEPVSTPMTAPQPVTTARPVASASPAPGGTGGELGNVTIATQAQIADKKAAVTVETLQLSEAVNKALAEAQTAQAAPVVTVEVAADAEISALEVALPVQALAVLAGHTEAAFTVTSTVAQVSLDQKALAAIVEQADTEVVLTVIPVTETEMTPAQVEASQGYPTFELTLRSGDVVISNFQEGSAKVILPYTLREGQQAKGIVVWYLADDGSVTPCETEYDEQVSQVTFVAPHFSCYAIAYDETLVPGASTVEQATEQTSTESLPEVEPESTSEVWSLLLVVVVAALVLIMGFAVGRRIYRR